MSDLIKRLRKAFNTFPIIEDSPVDLFQEAADKLEAAEHDLAFYRCCALSGEVPKAGSEPSATLKGQDDEG